MALWSKKTDARRAAPGVAPRDERGELPELGDPLRGSGHLDWCEQDVLEPALTEGEAKLADAVVVQLQNPGLEMPHLPATHLRLINLAANPECDVAELSRLLSTDVVLTASLLRTANSVLYGGVREIDSVRTAIARIGLRGLRSMLYMQSLKSVMYRPPGLVEHADEIWRQACATALITRTLASFSGRDAERAFVLGLLHDVGRVPVLKALADLGGRSFTFRHAFVRQVLHTAHEAVGAQLAANWNLPDELALVCGAHHAVDPGAPHAEAAGLVALADRLDRVLATADRPALLALAADEASIARAGLAPDRGRAALVAAVRAWLALRSEPSAV